MIVPLDSPTYDLYAKGRGPLAIPRDALLNVYSSSVSATFGFHPSLAGIQDLYNQGVLAVVAGVGRPVTPANRRTKPAANELPADLLQHTGASGLRYLADGYFTLSWAPGVESGTGSTSRTAAMEHNVSVASLPPSTKTSPQLSVGFPETVVGRQLATVFQALKAGATGQQVFVCPVDGFDTHTDQLATQAARFSELNDGVVAFYSALQALGIADRVTLFTQTEFNRTLAPNRTRGTDHAWAGHQLVLGRSVLGGQIYGRFPSLELGGPDDAGSTGVWIPSRSDLQYSATLASWVGRNDVMALPEFAALRNSPETDLGFLAK